MILAKLTFWIQLMTSGTIKENTLRELAASDSIASTAAIGRVGGFTVAVRCGNADRTLGNARGGVRLFSNLTNLATFLRSVGITNFAVESDDYEPGRIRSARPDRAAALKLTRTKPRQSTIPMSPL